MKKIIFISILILSLWNTEARARNLTLWITENFNQICLLDKETLFENGSVADILEKNTQVKSDFGGNFITSINGIEINAPEKESWFYYLNGVLSDVGAKQCVPESGSIIWWDFHSWDNNVYINAVIGAYPQPFLNGIEGNLKTVILYAASVEKKAGILKKSLEEKGVREVDIELCRRVSCAREAMFIIMGKWRDLSEFEFVKDIFKNYRRLNIFVGMEENKLGIMDTSFNVIEEFEKASVITAVKIGFGKTRKIIWFITGTDDKSVNEAVDVLLYEPSKIKFYSAAVIHEGEILNAPFLP
ncbi:MAG: DUF4430 domain-containing protein [Candidatus Omnitrophota bacterium]